LREEVSLDEMKFLLLLIIHMHLVYRSSIWYYWNRIQIMRMTYSKATAMSWDWFMANLATLCLKNNNIQV
jgi:hypothetical protein